MLDEPERVINVIHLASPPQRNNQARADARRVEHGKHVMSAELEPRSKKAKRSQPAIYFTDADLDGVKVPHNDPLILTLKIQSFKVQRILIDSGSSSEIMYFECFQRMRLDVKDLHEARTPLVGFSAKPVYPKGRISLKVQAGEAAIMTDFLVVDAPSPYNIIRGRTWLHALKAVPSTYHQLLRFPFEDDSGNVSVVTIRGDQQAAKQCLLAVVPAKEEPPKEINMAELEAELDAVGQIGRASCRERV